MTKAIYIHISITVTIIHHFLNNILAITTCEILFQLLHRINSMSTYATTTCPRLDKHRKRNSPYGEPFLKVFQGFIGQRSWNAVFTQIAIHLIFVKTITGCLY